MCVCVFSSLPTHMWSWHAMHSIQSFLYASVSKCNREERKKLFKQFQMFFSLVFFFLVFKFDIFPLFVFLLYYYKILLFYCVWQCKIVCGHFTEISGLRIWLVVFQHRRAMHLEHLRSAVLVVAVALVVLYRQFELDKSNRSPGAQDLNYLVRIYRKHFACYDNIYNLNLSYSCPNNEHIAQIRHDTIF